MSPGSHFVISCAPTPQPCPVPKTPIVSTDSTRFRMCCSICSWVWPFPPPTYLPAFLSGPQCHMYGRILSVSKQSDLGGNPSTEMRSHFCPQPLNSRRVKKHLDSSKTEKKSCILILKEQKPRPNSSCHQLLKKPPTVWKDPAEAGLLQPSPGYWKACALWRRQER